MATRLPVTKALRALEALNAKHTMSLAEIACRAGLAKPTAVRALASLEKAGYVSHLSRSAGYRLTSRVLKLSAGFDGNARVVEAAIGPMHAFTAREKWPLFIGVREGIRMVVRYGTVDESPLAVDPKVFAARSPMLLSALGRAYFAFASEAEAAQILAELARSRAGVDAIAREKDAVARIVRDVRRRGYATTDENLRLRLDALPRRWRDARHMAMGLAVPVLGPKGVLAAISLRYFDKLMTSEEAAIRYLGPLKRLAAEIARLAGE